MIGAPEALELLRQGNGRYVAGVSGHALSASLRRDLTAGQEPFAVVLGCSDSRVPVELVFDRGPGDLFVIRVAGNVVAPSLVGSVEFAAARFGTRLIVVLGHSDCGAVGATLEELSHPGEIRSPNLQSIVDRIRPAVEELLLGGADSAAVEELDRAALMARAVRANVRAAANAIRRGSEIIERFIEEDGLLVVGAEYSLKTGRVDFFDGVPDRT